jgi:hypothetical protein
MNKNSIMPNSWKRSDNTGSRNSKSVKPVSFMDNICRQDLVHIHHHSSKAFDCLKMHFQIFLDHGLHLDLGFDSLVCLLARLLEQSLSWGSILEGMVVCMDIQQLLDDQLGTVVDNDIQDASLEMVYSNSVALVDLSVVVEVAAQVVVVVEIYRLVDALLAVVTVVVPGLMAFVSASLRTSSV